MSKKLKMTNKHLTSRLTFLKLAQKMLVKPTKAMQSSSKRQF